MFRRGQRGWLQRVAPIGGTVCQVEASGLSAISTYGLTTHDS
jgi:hypothetical protein